MVFAREARRDVREPKEPRVNGAHPIHARARAYATARSRS